MISNMAHVLRRNIPAELPLDRQGMQQQALPLNGAYP